MTTHALHWLATELGHPGLADEGIEASRNACAAGASIAAAAITAAAYYDNPITGAGALRALMSRLGAVPIALDAWCEVLAPGIHPETNDPHFTPGFGFVTEHQAELVLAACRRITEQRLHPAPLRCRFMSEHQRVIANVAGPLNAAGLAALVFLDHGYDLEHAERHWLLCKVETALIEAQKARRAGIAAFPFSEDNYFYEGPRPSPAPFDMTEAMRRLGLEGLRG